VVLPSVDSDVQFVVSAQKYLAHSIHTSKVPYQTDRVSEKRISSIENMSYGVRLMLVPSSSEITDQTFVFTFYQYRFILAMASSS